LRDHDDALRLVGVGDRTKTGWRAVRKRGRERRFEARHRRIVGEKKFLDNDVGPQSLLDEPAAFDKYFIGSLPSRTLRAFTRR